jgi:glycosyltransferase involved in cell wall biosynthesis
MKGRLNLIILIPSLNWGGMGRTAADLSRMFPPSIRQTIVLLEDKVAYPFRADLRVLSQSTMERLPVRGLRLFLNVMRFRKIVKEVKPDVVLAFHHNARVINCLTGLTFVKPPYRSINGVLDLVSQWRSFSAVSRTFLHRFMESLTHRQSDRIVACSEGVKSDLIATFNVRPEKIVVINSPVDVGKILKMAKEPVDHPWFAENIPLIVAASRLAPNKNQTDLLKAFARVRAQRPCRLILLGDGPLKESLLILAGELGISDDVLFLGFQHNPFKFVAGSTVFVLPCLFEALGKVLIEAMAVGCPVVSYDCPVGPREILAPGTARPARLEGIEQAAYGLLVPTGDVEALAEAIQRLMDDRTLKETYSNRGPARAIDFDVAKSAERYLKVIEDSPIEKGTTRTNMGHKTDVDRRTGQPG